MRAEVVLGFDPCPGSVAAATGLAAALRSAARGVVEARVALNRLAVGGPGWDGPAGDAVLGVVRALTARLELLEDGLTTCQPAVERWRTGLDGRRQQVDDIVAAITQLGDAPDADESRRRLTEQARALEQEHTAATTELVRPFEELAEALTLAPSESDDLAGDLDRALARLADAVDAWVAEHADELVQTARLLGEVAGLTTVVTELLGVAGLGRTPEDTEGVREIVSRSPGSHRLVRALRQQWHDSAPEELPEATFAQSSPHDLADLLAAVSAPRDEQAPDSGSGE